MSIRGTPCLPTHFVDLPGSTVEERLHSLLDLLHGPARIVLEPPHLVNERERRVAWEYGAEVLAGEAAREDPETTRRVLIAFFRAEPDPDLADILAGCLGDYLRTEAGKAAFGRIVAEMSVSSDAATRVKGLAWLGWSMPPGAEEIWIRAVTEDPSDAVREIASSNPPPRSENSRATLLRAAAEDRSAAVRRQAIFQFGLDASAAETVSLVGLLRSEREAAVQGTLVDTLANAATVRDVELWKALAEVARDASRDSGVRSRAARSILSGPDIGVPVPLDPAVLREMEDLYDRFRSEELKRESEEFERRAREAAAGPRPAPPPPPPSESPVAVEPPVDENDPLAYPERSGFRHEDYPGETLEEKVSLHLERGRALIRAAAAIGIKVVMTPEERRIRDAHERWSGDFFDLTTRGLRDNPAPALATLRKLLTAERDPEVADDLVHRLQTLSLNGAGTAEFRQLIGGRLASPDPDVRRRALRWLKDASTRETLAQWESILKNDPSEEVRNAAAWALPEDAVEWRSALLRAAKEDAAVKVRTTAIYAVAQAPSSSELHELIGLLRGDPDPVIQTTVIDGIQWNCTRRDAEVAPALLEVARDAARTVDVRLTAIDAALQGTMGGEGFVTDPTQRRELEALRKALNPDGRR
ncbi:MAG: HEAT repeat domain-containing protein [Planctomycetes bacterium]|nr:HEAT repeat domain-containing protein [Planctomycetota bacterium]